MTDLKPIVALTKVNMQPLSRKDMLEWVNNTVNAKYTKVEELCSGIAYCQMMEQLFPDSIGLKKVKTTAKLEHEHLHNLRLLQTAFTRLKFDKSIPIDRLLKGRFQDNFEFLQWFKKFYDTTCMSNGKENIPNPMAKAELFTKSGKESKLSKNLTVKQIQPPRCVSPSTVCALQEDIDGVKAKLEYVTSEKDFYFKKLQDVEAILNREKGSGRQTDDFCKRALKILNVSQSDSTEDSKSDFASM